MQPSTPSTAEAPTPGGDPFIHGWRYVPRSLPDGSTAYDQVPLTLEDVLHPQEDDVIPVRPIHEIDCSYLVSVFRSRPIGPPVVWVAGDWRIDWGRPDIGCHQPDVAVIVGMHELPDLMSGTLDLPQSGGRCPLVIEVVSPTRRRVDVLEKVREYHAVGIPLYVIVDQEGDTGPRSIVAYRRTPERYEAVPLDAEGRIYLEVVQLWLGLCDGRVVCYDADGRELGDYTQIARDLDEADRRIQEQAQALEESVEQTHQAERRADDEARGRQEAERQRQEAERQRQEAERQRLEAERQRQEAELRAAEEARRRLEALREAADARRAQEASARQAAEHLKLIEALQKQLQRQQGLPDPGSP